MRISRLIFVVLTTVGLATGCQQREEEIRSYTVQLVEPRIDPTKPRLPAGHPALNTDAGKPGAESTMLGALIAGTGNTAWSLKVTGPVAAMESFRTKFADFVKTVRLSDDKPQWMLPEGWQEIPGSGLRYATLRVENNEPPLEIAVNRFTATPQFLPDNVNRWRGQMGLPPLSGPEVKDVIEVVALSDDVSAALVTITGRSQGGGMQGPPK